MDTATETKADPFTLATEKVRKANPGTEIWFGRHPKTGDRWIYRGANKHETRIYRKTYSAEKEKGAEADADVPNMVLAESCVLWPPKVAEPDDPANPEGLTLFALIARRPMILSTIAADVCVVSGYTDEAEQKKL
jgi:hypothetical protein